MNETIRNGYVRSNSGGVYKGRDAQVSGPRYEYTFVKRSVWQGYVLLVGLTAAAVWIVKLIISLM